MDVVSQLLTDTHMDTYMRTYTKVQNKTKQSKELWI